MDNSPSRKPNEKVVAGVQEYTDEIMRSHYLMHKIRVKEYIGPHRESMEAFPALMAALEEKRPQSTFDTQRLLQSA